MKNIWIIVPAYNEGERLNKVISLVRKYSGNMPTIVIDDGSKKPVSLHKRENLTVLKHEINLGKGAALKTGISFAFRHGAQAVILLDADGQHDPQEIGDFVAKLEEGYDVIFGTRRSGRDMPLVRLLGNKFASIYVNLIFGIYVSDIPSGYRAISKKAYQKIEWQSPRYSVETEMVANLGKHKHELKYTEIPVKTLYLDNYKGFTVFDAISIFWQVLWWKLF